MTWAYLHGSDNVLVVKLERPAPDLPEYSHTLRHPLSTPKLALILTHRNRGSPTDPIFFTRWRPSTSVELARDPNYWDREIVRIAKVQAWN